VTIRWEGKVPLSIELCWRTVIFLSDAVSGGSDAMLSEETVAASIAPAEHHLDLRGKEVRREEQRGSPVSQSSYPL
jgi:hypothetical protein